MLKQIRTYAARFLSAFTGLCLLASALPLAGWSATAQTDAIRLEAEADDVYSSITCGADVKGQFEKRQGDFSASGFSGGYAFVNVLQSGEGVPDVVLTLKLTVPAAGDYDLSITTKDNADRGVYTAAIDGQTLQTMDFYNKNADFYVHSLGRVTFSGTTASLTLTCTGANPSSTGKYGLAVDYITVTPAKGQTPEPEPDPTPDQPGAPIHTLQDMYACTYTDTSIQRDPLRYRLYIPADYSADQAYPLLVYLNGAGSRGTDNEKQLANLAPLINPLIDNPDYPCIVAVPQLPGDKQWVNTDWTLGSYDQTRVAESDSLKMLMGMIGDLQKTYAVDANRLYLMGQSFGGYGTWDAITRYPDTFAAAIPLCGAGDPAKAEAIKDMPLLVLHGTGDGSVPVSGSQEMVAALRQAGSRVTYLEYEDADHYIQRRLFEQPDIWLPWLFAQSKGQPETAPDFEDIYKVTANNTFMFNGNSLPDEWTWTGANLVGGGQLTMTASGGTAAMGILNTTANETDGMVSAFITIDSGFTGGGGLVFRYQDSQNYGHVRLVSNGLELLEMIDGQAAVKTAVDYDWVPGRIACLKVALQGNRVTVSVDNDRVLDTSLKSEALHGCGAVGLRYYNGSMKVDDFVFARPGSTGRISPVDFADRQVIQRNPDTTAQTVSFTGSARVEGMERLEVAVTHYADEADVVLDWQPVTVDAATGSYEAAYTIPQGGWYRTHWRAIDKNGSVLATEQGDARWGVGMNILCIGQSNMVGQGQPMPFVQADDRVSNFLNEQWMHLEDPYQQGDTSIAGGTCGGSMVPTIGNILTETYHIPVGFIPAAQNGASLMAEDNGWLKRNANNPTDRSNLYGNSLFRAKAAGGIEFIIMNQGENNVSRGTDAEAYRQGLETLIGYYRQDLGYNVPLIYGQLGAAMASSWDASRDPYMTGIRSAQAQADNGVTLIMGGSEIDLSRNADNLHYTTASQAVIGQRMANAILYCLGDATYYKGPEITGAVFANARQTTIEVTIRHTGGTDITPTDHISGFDVLVDGKPVPVTAAVRQDATTIALTLEKAAKGTVTVRYLYGCLPDVTGLVRDNSPLQLPLLPTNGEITVSPAPPEPSPVIYGDVDGDGKVDVLDALMALQAAAGNIRLTAPQRQAADVDGKPEVSAQDALLILQRATRRMLSFPVELSETI